MRKAALLAAVLALPAAASAWSDPIHQRVAARARLLMPPSLAAQLDRNADQLLAGAIAPDRETRPETHALHADGTAGDLDAQVADAVREAIALVRDRGSFADLAFALGRISHLVSDCAYPPNTSASDPREERFYADYDGYALLKLEKFPQIFGGYERFDGGFDVAAYVRQVAATANRRYPMVAHAYFPDGGAMRSSSQFDDRGPAFGVAQLSFTAAVSATANLWLYVWREAHGNLAGTPHYPPGRSLHAESGARAAQRP